MVLDLSNNEDKIRLRVGDYQDPVFLPTSVYTATLAENNNDVKACVPIIGTYILAILAQRTHQKLSYMEIWGSEAYNNYKDWLVRVVRNPNINGVCPIPYSASNDSVHPLIEFQQDWNANFVNGTQSEQLSDDANGRLS